MGGGGGRGGGGGGEGGGGGGGWGGGGGGGEDGNTYAYFETVHGSAPELAARVLSSTAMPYPRDDAGVLGVY